MLTYISRYCFRWFSSSTVRLWDWDSFMPAYIMSWRICSSLASTFFWSSLMVWFKKVFVNSMLPWLSASWAASI